MAKTKERGEERLKRPEPIKRDGAYVMMLFITLVAVATGCVLLHLDNDEYGKTQPPKEAPVVRKLGEELKVDPVAAPPAPAPVDPMAPAPMPPMMP